MRMPVLSGIIDRRILVNYRVTPEIVKALLPPHMDPVVINGYASAGICLLRLKNIGTPWSPSFLRMTSENAAHRFLVKYRDGEKEVSGVYIPGRDTDSLLNVWLAGKLFSWPHHHAQFKVKEGGGRYSVRVISGDGRTNLYVSAELSNVFPMNSMFDSIDHASACFQECSTGVSPSADGRGVRKVCLRTKTWAVMPLHVLDLRSNFFDNTKLFPDGTIGFDNALLMEEIEHEWDMF